MKALKFTQKQKRFVQEYLICLNATEAAKRAGYSENVASVIGFENLQKPKIKELIEQTLNAVASEKTASLQEVLEYLTSVMRGESQAQIVVVEGIGEGCSEARAMQKAPDEKERLKAAELLGKRYGLFTDKVNLEVEPVVIVNDLKE